ncbi:MAG: hypothetical protein JNL11_13640 [Bdellovibrionaceae bacterium]|nr:hypothetical protein [Pseudobdellovibrionaceae bacterium]
MNMTASKAIKLSWVALMQKAILIRLLIPIGLAIAISLGLLSWGWPLVSHEFVPFLNNVVVIHWIFSHLDTWLGFSLLTAFALFLFIILIFITTYFILILLTSLILVPLLTPVIQKNYFPGLVETYELTWFDGLKNTLVATMIFLAALIIGSPLLFIPGGQIVYPFLLNSFLSKRIFPLDAAQNYATTLEYKKLILNERPSLWTLAFLTNGYVYIPILNFLAAPLIALAFIFFCLGKINEYRTTN